MISNRRIPLIRTISEKGKRLFTVAALALVLACGGLLSGAASNAACMDATLEPYSVARGTALERRILHAARYSVQYALGGGSWNMEKIPWPAVPAGVFITLMETGRVRACAGSFLPAEGSLSGALMELGRQVISVDMRRDPVELEELEGLKLVVSFVGRPRVCPDPYAIDFRREGLKTLVNGQQRLLLPGESRTLSYGIRNILGVQDPAKTVFERFCVVTMDERNWEDVR